MVNVLIREFAPGGAVIDAAALAQFQQRWATYRKLAEHDYLSHREIGRKLNETLNEVFGSPFRFLDIACGDASIVRTALQGTAVSHYLGLDLSEAALRLAAARLYATGGDRLAEFGHPAKRVALRLTLRSTDAGGSS